MKVAIMQPYFLPYIGYWQLMNTADVFVLYDNIEYVKKGWINRNRYLCNGEDKYFTLQLKKDSDFLMVKQRYLSENFDYNKICNQIKSAYHKAPNYNETYMLFEEIINCSERNLFEYIKNSIVKVKNVLDIQTPIIISSTLDIDHSLKGKEKVYAICKNLKADTYINPIGGVELYDKEEFKKQGIDLLFLKSDFEKIQYKQFGTDYIPALSILDLLMFNSKETIQKFMNYFDLI